MRTYTVPYAASRVVEEVTDNGVFAVRVRCLMHDGTLRYTYGNYGDTFLFLDEKGKIRHEFVPEKGE